MFGIYMFFNRIWVLVLFEWIFFDVLVLVIEYEWDKNVLFKGIF